MHTIQICSLFYSEADGVSERESAVLRKSSIMTTSCTGWVVMTMTQKQWGHFTNPPPISPNLQGSQAPKSRLHGCLEHHSFPIALPFFPMQAKARPLLVPPWSICFSQSPHQPSPHPPIPRYQKPNLWPPFRRVRLLFVFDSRFNPSELQVQFCCKGIICPHKRRRLISIRHL